MVLLVDVAFLGVAVEWWWSRLFVFSRLGCARGIDEDGEWDYLHRLGGNG